MNLHENLKALVITGILCSSLMDACLFQDCKYSFLQFLDLVLLMNTRKMSNCFPVLTMHYKLLLVLNNILCFP